MSATVEKKTSSSSKAGRHRIYSNEQRKDRNRKAQAAFRDRRNKYTESLEEAIDALKQHNQSVQGRAQLAERRCVQLAEQVAVLQRLLAIALSTTTASSQKSVDSCSMVGSVNSTELPTIVANDTKEEDKSFFNVVDSIPAPLPTQNDWMMESNPMQPSSAPFFLPCIEAENVNAWLETNLIDSYSATANDPLKEDNLGKYLVIFLFTTVWS